MKSFEEFKESFVAEAEGELVSSVSAEQVFEALYLLEKADEQMEKFYGVLRKLGASEFDFHDFESSQIDVNDAAGVLQKALGYYPADNGDTSFMDQFSAE